MSAQAARTDPLSCSPPPRWSRTGSRPSCSARSSAGRFREALYYRLNVVPVEVPALDRRREDIPDMVGYFVRRVAEATGLQPRNFSDDAVAVLQASEWPGNVRQLRNVVERLL